MVFLDEIDSLGSARSDSESAAQSQIKTEFLVQMDGVRKSGEDHRVLVLAATNLPWVLDSALRRRFERRIYIPLPDMSARKAFFEMECEWEITLDILSLTKVLYDR